MEPKGRPPELTNVLHETDTFREDVELFMQEISRGELEQDAATSLGLAVIALKDHQWDGSLNFHPHGRYGDVFLYQFHPRLSIVFQRRTLRNAEKRPVRIELTLLAIHRGELP